MWKLVMGVLAPFRSQLEPPAHFAASHLNDHGDSTLFNISEPQFPYLIRGANF